MDFHGQIRLAGGKSSFELVNSHMLPSFSRLKPSFLGRKSLFLWLILKNHVQHKKRSTSISKMFVFPVFFRFPTSLFGAPQVTPRHRSTRRTPPGYYHQRPASRRPCPPGVSKKTYSPDLSIGGIPFIKGNIIIFGDPLINHGFSDPGLILIN